MALKDYLAAKARWLGWLDGDEHHSINGQLSQLLWQDAVFRSFNAARAEATGKGPSAAVAPILARFLDEGYVANLVLGISKLVEKSNPRQADKGVVSLRRIIDELKASQALLTRENYLAAENAPYDYAPVEQAALREMLDRSSNGVVFEWQQVGGASDWSLAKRLHETFDKLAGVDASARKPDDVVSADLLARLEAALEDPVFAKIRTLRHKSIAHAADQVSRPAGGVKGLTFNDVDAALKKLLGVRQLIQATILYDSWRAGSVPVPQHDQFQYLDLPFVGAGGVEILRTFWAEHCNERDGWLDDVHRQLLK